MRYFFIVILGLAALPVSAADPAPVRRAIDDFLGIQVQGLPGKSSYSVGTLDVSRLSDNCTGYDVSMLNGARPWGSTYVTVTCRGGVWNIRVPVRITVITDYLVSTRPLTAGQKIAEGDIRTQSGDISDLPTGTMLSSDQALGRVLSTSLPAGRPLRGDILRQPVVIQQGQNVRVISSGPGFQVANDGKALSNAAIGQVVQVRINSGTVLSGIARPDGTVEIRQ